jgi:hypothetical protein
MALVIVCHGLAAPGLDRQSRLGAVERLDLAFLVDGQHDSLGCQATRSFTNVTDASAPQAGLTTMIDGSVASAAAFKFLA